MNVTSDEVRAVRGAAGTGAVKHQIGKGTAAHL